MLSTDPSPNPFRGHLPWYRKCPFNGLRTVDLLTEISLTCLLYYFSSYGRTVTPGSLKNNLDFEVAKWRACKEFRLIRDMNP